MNETFTSAGELVRIVADISGTSFYDLAEMLRCPPQQLMVACEAKYMTTKTFCEMLHALGCTVIVRDQSGYEYILAQGINPKKRGNAK